MCEPEQKSDPNPEKEKLFVSARLPTNAENALVNYGREAIGKSVDIGIEFHKTMLSVSATFGTLITTVVPVLIWGNKDEKIPLPEGWLLIIPPLLMIFSSVAFALGYYPRHANLNPNDIQDIKRMLENTITSRKFFAGIGIGLFCAALLATVGLVFAIKANIV